MLLSREGCERIGGIGTVRAVKMVCGLTSIRCRETVRATGRQWADASGRRAVVGRFARCRWLLYRH